MRRSYQWFKIKHFFLFTQTLNLVLKSGIKKIIVEKTEKTKKTSGGIKCVILIKVLCMIMIELESNI